ncbi:MAG: hypothetical protein HY812_14365 [Planctomycetes bacterium]|nr:hypothetical protein [Planctomycetota bacterium]
MQRGQQRLIVKMARAKPGWGYDRLQGALANLGHRVSASTVAAVLARNGIPPAPRRLPGVDVLEVLRSERRAFFERLHELKRGQALAEAGSPGTAENLLLDLAVLKLEAFLEWLGRFELTLSAKGRST